ncbi:MAG: DUF1566 domain-containing protein [Desulfobulbaceae bacterium]|jgi:hypothetical protein|nr:DUF1566 domain-containing protein [Desulfobulbaceae bacterium]HKJ13440.1 DUF1566 domain-containing protein [Desulfobulbales bacterium]MDH3542707.1 DUF1566 domain-containing protein [Desulfobulbaceae bacterium]MDH3782044.1 DUF1566 domain-containing protein [Desulfobulbaceae bacterium]MDH3865702.1 DUF1566 domain-containing protein [Desulfobulbaceae bacterium]
MSFFTKLGIDRTQASIDWDLQPADTFGMFESWGGKERVKNKNERFYYFYIDNWQLPARLLLMERGIKYARILARIEAPQELIDTCIAGQGKSTTLDASYAIDDAIKLWLQKNVVDSDNDSLVIPIKAKEEEVLRETGLPRPSDPVPELHLRNLRSTPLAFKEGELAGLIKRSGLFERRYNPEANAEGYLVDNGDGLTVTDRTTKLMWQRGGSDINSIRTIQSWIGELNMSNFAGHNDWRLPTFEEALSLAVKAKNSKELYLHRCFSAGQPFIFTSDKRNPGGHWFIDYAQARVFWASGFNPGGFGRVCRNI